MDRSLRTFAWDSSLNDVSLGSLRGSLCLETIVWVLSLCTFRFGPVAWELWLAGVRLAALTWERSLSFTWELSLRVFLLRCFS